MQRRSLPTSPRLEDVARLAGVSTATVSRCLNAPHRVQDETRLRVEKVIREIGYAPNFGARALASKRTNTIGAIIPTMESAIFARGLQAFQEELAVHGLTLLVASSSYRPDLEEEQIRTLLARGADALLLIGYERAQEIYDWLDQRGVPAVVCWTHRTDGPAPSVGFDNRSAMHRLAERVIDLGHTRLAIISAPQADNDRAQDRVAGVHDAVRAAGMDVDAIRLIETPYSVENGAEAMATLLEENPRPTAVFCGNDVLAAGAVRGARALGLSVPGDVSVTGFDDIEIAQIVDPPLTTVHVPHRQMGREAARLVARLLDGAADATGMALDTYVVEGASLGPAPR